MVLFILETRIFVSALEEAAWFATADGVAKAFALNVFGRPVCLLLFFCFCVLEIFREPRIVAIRNVVSVLLKGVRNGLFFHRSEGLGPNLSP